MRLGIRTSFVQRSEFLRRKTSLLMWELMIHCIALVDRRLSNVAKRSFNHIRTVVKFLWFILYLVYCGVVDFVASQILSSLCNHRKRKFNNFGLFTECALSTFQINFFPEGSVLSHRLLVRRPKLQSSSEIQSDSFTSLLIFP